MAGMMSPDELCTLAIAEYKRLAELAQSPDEQAYFNLLAALMPGYFAWLKANVRRLDAAQTMNAVINAAAALVLDTAVNVAPPGARIFREVLAQSFTDALLAKADLPEIGRTEFEKPGN